MKSSTTTKTQHQLALLACFSFGIQVLAVTFFWKHCWTALDIWNRRLVFVSMSQVLTLLGLKSQDFGVWWRASFLGQVFVLGVLIFTQAFADLIAAEGNIFGLYLIILSSFHLGEYLATAWTNPSNLSTDSFVINHSAAYHAAAILSWTEFFTELYFFKTVKTYRVFTLLGIILCTGGEILRKLAMLHAGENFNHIVQDHKRDDHVLITNGVFSLMRHPSYVGWFYWSVGTQLILCNPICVIGYALASWFFFVTRVQVEEFTLIQFFGNDYLQYQERVPTGLPFISGWTIRKQ